MSTLKIQVVIVCLLITNGFSLCDGRKTTAPKRKPSSGKVKTPKKVLPGMINYNNLDDFLAGKGEVFADITESVKLFKKMKEQMVMKNVTMMSQAEETEILAEIKVCKPIQAPRCFSECKISSSTKYLWCYVDSDLSSWETCGCKLRQDFINYWGMLRKELVKPKPKPLKVSGSPLTPREIALVSAMASLAIIMGLLLMALAVQFKRMKNQQPQLFGNGIFIHNPIYQAPNGNAPDEQ